VDRRGEATVNNSTYATTEYTPEWANTLYLSHDGVRPISDIAMRETEINVPLTH